MLRISARFGICGLLLAGLGLMSGCLVATSSQTTHTGSFVSDETWNKIEKGKTSQEWVLTVVGQPTQKSNLKDGKEIWKYTYTTRTQNGGGVFLLYAGSSSEETIGNAFIEFKDGIVTDWWRG